MEKKPEEEVLKIAPIHGVDFGPQEPAPAGLIHPHRNHGLEGHVRLMWNQRLIGDSSYCGEEPENEVFFGIWP